MPLQHLTLLNITCPPGLLTAILAELKPQPKANPSNIRDIIEVSDRDANADYVGHDAEAIASLFPQIRIFYGRDFPPEFTWRVFFLMSIEECRAGESWIDNGFSAALAKLGELELINVPYQTICRSIFDSDPASMFLALYRCIEALYAYSSAEALIKALQLKTSWPDLAASLEDTLGWYPREESSLTALMKLVDKSDLAEFLKSLGEDNIDLDLPHAVSKRIYLLRNSLVHYRPSHQKIDHKKIDWNRLCEAMTRLVSTIYTKVFENTVSSPSEILRTTYIPDNMREGHHELRRPIKKEQLILGRTISSIKRLFRNNQTRG